MSQPKPAAKAMMIITTAESSPLCTQIFQSCRHESSRCTTIETKSAKSTAIAALSVTVTMPPVTPNRMTKGIIRAQIALPPERSNSRIGTASWTGYFRAREMKKTATARPAPSISPGTTPPRNRAATETPLPTERA
jgi:hypothetical protein